QLIMGLIRAADTGILDMRVGQRPGVGRGPDGMLTPISVPELTFRHRGQDDMQTWFPLKLESAGTRALIHIAPLIVDALRDGGLLCVDELEASLHPTLALNVVRLFNDAVHNPNNAQLVFATHDTNLLGSVVGEPALRRDQIWFTEKDADGGTDLYPL